MGCFMGIDIGTSAVKAIIMDDTGTVIGSGRQDIGMLIPQPAWAEQDPESWWHACIRSMTEAVQSSGQGSRVAGIGVTGQMLGHVMLNQNKEPLGNCMIWLDQRAAAEQAWLEKTIGNEKIIGITSNILHSSLWAAKLLWMKKYQPDQLAQARYILFPKDYIKMKLTGEISLEVSDASGTGLFDVKNRTWSKDLIDILELPFDFVNQKIYESQEICGYLQDAAARRTGIRSGIPVVAGAGDQQACGIGSGAVQEGVVSATIGTSGVMFTATKRPIPDTGRCAAMAYCHAVPDLWCLFGCTLAAGGSLKWLKDNILFHDRANVASPYDKLTEMAAKAVAGSEGLLFLPYLNGERTPYPDPNARGVFFGLSCRHGINELCRSVMEGVTFSLKDTLMILEKAGICPTEIRASGGGANSKLWLQIQADIFNTKVVTINVKEKGCAGAAILAGAGTGYFHSVKEACDRIVKPVSETLPDEKNVRKYLEFYLTYRDLYPALKNIFTRQAERCHTLPGCR